MPSHLRPALQKGKPMTCHGLLQSIHQRLGKKHAAVSLLGLLSLGLLLMPVFGQAKKDPPKPVDINPPHISTDKSVKYDYDIVYVRQPRYGDDRRPGWADFSDPTRMELGSDLMLLHPDGSE